jgi:hypothetical protein
MSPEITPDLLVYGPLTREAHNRLSATFYDGGGVGPLADIARQRGITGGDFLRPIMADVLRPSDQAEPARPPREPGESQEDYETRVRFGRR